MPSSFSRFLSEEEMRRVRDLYLRSLEESGLGDEPPSAVPQPSDRVEGPPPSSVDDATA